MDFTLKQWKDQQQHESEDEQQQQQQNSSKIPRTLLIDSPQNHPQTVLPLFVSADTNSNKFSSHFSATSTYPDYSSTSTAIPTTTSRFSIGGRYCFSREQWEELELQALIYRHMVAGSAIPLELLHLIKKSLITSPYYLHHYPPSSLLQAGYWGKGAMDPEPGRCRRTDGKKWRCSRDVVAGHKYCERHVHRGRNRSRKPVEFPAFTGAGGGCDAVHESLCKPSEAFTGGSVGGGAHFQVIGSGSSSFDAFQVHAGRSGELRSEKKTLFDTQQYSTSGDGKSNNRVLMDFFDDWPRSIHESTRSETNGSRSSTSLSISTPGNSTSDFLRLSTPGNADEAGHRDRHGNEDREAGQISWTGGWGGNPVASVGGPLAEALRSSSNSSPTSVLHQ